MRKRKKEKRQILHHRKICWHRSMQIPVQGGRQAGSNSPAVNKFLVYCPPTAADRCPNCCTTAEFLCQYRVMRVSTAVFSPQRRYAPSFFRRASVTRQSRFARRNNALTFPPLPTPAPPLACCCCCCCFAAAAARLPRMRALAAFRMAALFLSAC